MILHQTHSLGCFHTLCSLRSVFTGPSLRDCLFGGLVDHWVHFFRLISSCKVQLPGFLPHFTRFKVGFHHVFCLGLDPVFISAEQSGAVFPVPCNDYSVERRINGRHLPSAPQPAGELGGRLCAWEEEKKKRRADEWHRKGEREGEQNKLTLNKAAEVFT